MGKPETIKDLPQIAQPHQAEQPGPATLSFFPWASLKLQVLETVVFPSSETPQVLGHLPSKCQGSVLCAPGTVQSLLCQGMLQKEPGIAFWPVASHVPPWPLRAQGLLFLSTQQMCEEGLLSIRGSEQGFKEQRVRVGLMPGTLHSGLGSSLTAAV